MVTQLERTYKRNYMRKYRKKESAKEYQKEYFKKYYKENKDKIKKQTNDYYKNNLEEGKEKRREYQKKNFEKRKPYYNEYYKENKDKMNKRMKELYEKNKKRYFKAWYKKKKERLKTDTNFKLKETLSSRIRGAIMKHKGIKESSSIQLLGAPIEVVRKHLESQFESGMTWDNHSTTGWHIDHIVPLDTFTLSDIKQQKLAFNYSNLQPLWYDDNIRKDNDVQGQELLE